LGPEDGRLEGDGGYEFLKYRILTSRNPYVLIRAISTTSSVGHLLATFV
jgi:hypothetical protein